MHETGDDGEVPTPGIMVNPYEFGPAPSQQVNQIPIQPMQQRIGSPFNDYQRVQPIINNVIVQRGSNNKIVLPKLPKKSQKGDTANGQDVSGRSPLRTTSYFGIMEMIKEEEA